MFIFQACYGTPHGPLYEYGSAPMSFTLYSASTGEPLEGIHIYVQAYEGQQELGVTATDGHCHVDIPYVKNELGPYLRFQDSDNRFAAKDTMLADLRERDIVIKLKEVAQ